MFGERDRLRAPAGRRFSTMFMKKTASSPGRWPSSVEELLEQFSEVAAPFRPLIEQLTAGENGSSQVRNLCRAEKILGRQRIEHASRNRHRHGRAPLSGISAFVAVPFLSIAP